MVGTHSATSSVVEGDVVRERSRAAGVRDGAGVGAALDALAAGFGGVDASRVGSGLGVGAGVDSADEIGSGVEAIAAGATPATTTAHVTANATNARMLFPTGASPDPEQRACALPQMRARALSPLRALLAQIMA
ncbi:hypothetical protein Microterr_04280 [Microbacterium terricola]|uniref:Uncharacterized protein n=1 Tax=Microbacterium terricola TaxID=344163 RepID=A0ABM8DVS0_9MICO|nr:hypothetical protein Microterr_04280 [Microbacterium terricola]